MFTGLVATMGRVQRVTLAAGSARLAIRSSLPVASMAAGESVAVDGVCLTVAGRRGTILEMDAVPETLERTTLGAVDPGDRLNVECDVLARYVGRLLETDSRLSPLSEE